jgi:hypothetical protein
LQFLASPPPALKMSFHLNVTAGRSGIGAMPDSVSGNYTTASSPFAPAASGSWRCPRRLSTPAASGSWWSLPRSWWCPRRPRRHLLLVQGQRRRHWGFPPGACEAGGQHRRRRAHRRWVSRGRVPVHHLKLKLRRHGGGRQPLPWPLDVAFSFGHLLSPSRLLSSPPPLGLRASLLMVYIRIKVQVDLRTDKSSIVVK